MGEDMPPLTSTMEALPIRTGQPSKPAEIIPPQRVVLEEGEVDEQRLLVGYSSSPPSLIKDRSGVLGEKDGALPKPEVQSLYNDIELSLYEYASLEERYRTLSRQHCELRKLTQAYDEIIQGSLGYDDDAASVEQLRAEAGREGLRAKAFEADILKPMVREAGGIQALASRMQSIETLIEEAGGIHKLKELVADAYRLRSSLDEVGGLQGLKHVTSQNHRLRSEQQKLAELRASVDGPDGIRAKAHKYHMLQQAFATIERNHAVAQAQPAAVIVDTARIQPARTNSNVRSVQALREACLAEQSTLKPKAAATMNPARAAMLSVPPRGRDPNRDLYEAPPPKQKPSTKTGSNDVPLGKRRAGSSSIDQGYVDATQKRRYEGELQLGIAKRPRVDVGHASELVQCTLQGRPRSANDPNYGRLEPVNEHYGGSLQNTSMSVGIDTGVAAPGLSSQWNGRLSERLERPERAPFGDSVYPQCTPMVKR